MRRSITHRFGPSFASRVVQAVHHDSSAKGLPQYVTLCLGSLLTISLMPGCVICQRLGCLNTAPTVAAAHSRCHTRCYPAAGQPRLQSDLAVSRALGPLVLSLLDAAKWQSTGQQQSQQLVAAAVAAAAAAAYAWLGCSMPREPTAQHVDELRKAGAVVLTGPFGPYETACASAAVLRVA